MPAKSKQPRFENKEKPSIFTQFSYLPYSTLDTEDVPVYSADTRKRDTWLQNFWKQEPHLMGVLHSMASIDSNRGWSLVGGRNQVIRFTEALHNWKVAPGLYGWRPGCNAAALSFYTSDLGAVVELGRDGKNGPMRELFHTAPNRCRVTGMKDTPLEYTPLEGTATQFWREMDFMRMTSMPEVVEDKAGIGYCFLSRVLVLAQIMIAIYQHDKEALGARAPRGLLLLMGITQQQWETAMRTRKAELDGEGWKYYNAVAVLASMNQSLDAKLIALSSLPANFDLQKFISLLMYGYALCAGYDPSEFYPVQFGALGRGTEMEVQHEKATGKGGKNYSLALQEQLQRPDVLPTTLEFQFDERDDQGEKLKAEVAQAWATLYKTMRETGLTTDGQGAISREEERYLLAEKELIPEDWAQVEPEVTATDEEDAEAATEEAPLPSEQQPEEMPIEEEILPETLPERQRRILRDDLLSRPRVFRAAKKFPREPVVRYRWPQDKAKIIWRSGADLLHPRLYARGIKRAVSKPLYESPKFEITEDDVDHAISEAKKVNPEFAQLLDNEPTNAKGA